MESKKPCKSPPFPVMSAHFAHTLVGMEEKYVKIQFIELSEAEGYIPKESLDLLKLSRENKIVFDNDIYDLKTINHNLYIYLNTYSYTEDDRNIIKFKQINLDINSGYYRTKVIITEDGKIIQELSYELALLRDKLSTISGDLNNVKSDLSDTNAKVNEKVNVDIVPDMEDETNITLKIFK